MMVSFIAFIILIMLLNKQKKIILTLAVIGLLLQVSVYAESPDTSIKPFKEYTVSTVEEKQEEPVNEYSISTDEAYIEYFIIPDEKLQIIEKEELKDTKKTETPKSKEFNQDEALIEYTVSTANASQPPDKIHPVSENTEKKYDEGSHYDDLDSSYDVHTLPDPAQPLQPLPELFPVTLDDMKTDIGTIRYIDLKSSLEMALTNNLDILMSDARASSGRWKSYGSFASMLPSVNLVYNYARYKGTVLVGDVVPVDVERTSIVPALTANLEAFRGFRNLFNSLSAHHEFKAFINDKDSTIDSKLYEVTEAYYNLLKNKTRVLISEKAVEDAREQLNLNENRFKAGTGTRLDIMQSQTLLSEAEQRLIQNQNSLKLSIVLFANIIGSNLFNRFLPDETTVARKKLIDDALTLEDMVDIALVSRAEVEREREQIKALVMKKRAAFSDYLPQATVSGGVQGSGERISYLQRSQYISVNLSWLGLTNLGTSGIIKSKEIGYQVEEAKLKLEKTLRDIQQDVISSYYDRESALKLIKNAEDELESSSESLRLSAIRLKTGVGTNTDLIAAQLEFVRAKSNWVNAVVEYNLAEAKLLKDMGVIDIQKLENGVSKAELISLLD